MPFPSGDQFSDVPHPDSDIPEQPTEEERAKGVVAHVNGLGCGIGNCKADFNHPMTRSWHISQRHPGEYSGATNEMSLFEEVTGINMGFNKRYLFKKGDPKPVRGVDFGPGID